ncbi:VWA domain-containing protein [Hyphomicrobium methylovorum]|uniref:TadE/TadG family type IV pilus assembly protein n=1 Tax=Hyphomicrobium methylovorum TaxID=84 RepID=UPI0015E64B38|nr:VWA domain-containing protein [Hyphomicrobium methylovorum]MBA2125550.1 VWA domain-containing protein [Hyphomicrobium methylovorum]
MEIGGASGRPAQPSSAFLYVKVSLRRAARPFQRFSKDTRGDVAMLFGLMALAIFMMIGLAVDYGRFINARSQTIAATDAAVLAAARALQTNGGDQNAALAVANAYYSQAVQNRIGVYNDTINFQIADKATAVVTIGNATVKTPFMGLAGTKSLPILHADGTDYSKAVLAVGGNAELNLEISMMLDISGSMCDRAPSDSQPPCASATKLDAMKAAAADLVDIVVWADQSKFKSRVAIVPFSGDVRPTADLFQFATGQSQTSSPSNVVYSVKKNNRTTNYTYKPSPCVAERPGKIYTDAKPASGNYILREFTDDGNCVVASTATVMPMTNDKTELKNRISSLAAKGATAGHVGTAWTYYMLAPNWADKMPAISKPTAYKTANTQKIAILMTDGEFNSEHDSKGVTTTETGAGSSVNATSSSEQAKAICKEMKKNDNIEIYTVGFQLGGNSTAIDTLSNCATDASHFYQSSTGDALKAAFRDIALKISTLYLSQ